MIEVKYLKELPVKSLNNPHAYLRVTGADIYVDKDNNRYAYISFQNVLNRRFYSLYISMREYDADGLFIRESKACYPCIYWSKGTYITEKPVRLTNECDGLEVKICFAESNGVAFFDDTLHRENLRHLEEFIPEAYCELPPSTGTFLVGEGLQTEESVNAATDGDEVEENSELVKEENITNIDGEDVIIEEVPLKEEFEKDAKVKLNRLGFNFASLIALAASGLVILLVCIIASCI